MKLFRLLQFWRRFLLWRSGVQFDRSVILGPGIRVGNSFVTLKPGTVQVGAGSELGAHVELNPWDGHIKISRQVFIGPGVVVYGQGGVEIGEQTLIAAHCGIFSSEHIVPEPGKFIRDQRDRLLPTRIGRDVWLGAGVKVLGGVTIGDGCVVGAGAVVTKDLPAYSIAVGIPARVIGGR